MINLNNVLKKLTDKPIYYGLMAVFLTIYGPRLHPKLPDGIRELFNNNIFRFAIITLIIYLSNRDLQLALIIALTFIIIMSLSNSCHCHEVLREKFGLNENYSDFDTLSEFYEDFQNKVGGEGCKKCKKWKNCECEKGPGGLPPTDCKKCKKWGKCKCDDDNEDDNDNAGDDNGNADDDNGNAGADHGNAGDDNDEGEETYFNWRNKVLGAGEAVRDIFKTTSVEDFHEKYTSRPSIYEGFDNIVTEEDLQKLVGGESADNELDEEVELAEAGDGVDEEGEDEVGEEGEYENYENQEDVGEEVTIPSDQIVDFTDIEQFVDKNKTPHEQLRQYETFLKKAVNQYKFTQDPK
jgi:hypothetical protein